VDVLGKKAFTPWYQTFETTKEAVPDALHRLEGSHAERSTLMNEKFQRHHPETPGSFLHCEGPTSCR
jgi:hypothetical protein